jgi:hypothetical protein
MWDSNAPTDRISANVYQENLGHSQTLVTEDAVSGLRFLEGEQGGPLLRAVVPRGFGLKYDGRVDRHLLQVGFNFTELMLPGLFRDITWEASMIMKENANQNFIASEMVSVVGGMSVLSLPSPVQWSLRPQKQTTCPQSAVNNGSHSEWVTVHNVPFDHAIPVLSMWDIGDICTEHHVRKLGVWIENWYYVKSPTASTGTLIYKIASVFNGPGSKGNKPPRYEVNILGFNYYQ